MANIDKDPDFLKAFWYWFDSLSLKDKEFFWYLKEDVAATRFYFKYYESFLNANS